MRTWALACSIALASSVPASSEPRPIVVVARGPMNVCDASASLIDDSDGSIRRRFPAYRCRYYVDDPTWLAKRMGLHPWPEPPPAHGLFMTGVGPGATGPYALTADDQHPFPDSNCVADGTWGCVLHLEGILGNDADSETKRGAHCDSSGGEGPFRLLLDDGRDIRGTMRWNRSPAGVFLLEGRIVTGGYRSAYGWVSWRSGDGNCGITQETTRFLADVRLVVV